MLFDVSKVLYIIKAFLAPSTDYNYPVGEILQLQILIDNVT